MHAVVICNPRPLVLDPGCKQLAVIAEAGALRFNGVAIIDDAGAREIVEHGRTVVDDQRIDLEGHRGGIEIVHKTGDLEFARHCLAFDTARFDRTVRLDRT